MGGDILVVIAMGGDAMTDNGEVICGHDLDGFDVWALRRSKSEKLGCAGQCLSLMPRQANDALRTKSECHVDDSLRGYLCMTTPAAA